MNERLVIVLLQFGTALVVLLLSLVAWRRRASGKAAIFLALCLSSVTVYAFGYGMELLSNSLAMAMFWVRIQHWGIQLIAPTWLLFALSVTGFDKKIKPWLIVLLGIIPLYLLATSQTLGWLNLAHLNPRMETGGAFPIFSYDRNMWNYIAIGYYSFCLGISTILFTIFSMRTARSSRKQAIVYLLGSIPPWIGLFLYNLQIFETNIDFTPVMLGLSGLFFVYGFTQLNILDVIPLARDIVFEKMGTATMILDREDRLVDFNPAMQEIFPALSQKMIGTSAYEIFTSDPSLLDLIREDFNDRTELKFTVGDNVFFYRVNKSIICNRLDELLGQVIIFYEFTKEKELMERLEWIAARDGLTGIYNRQHFDEIARKEIARQKRYGGNLSMIMVDLDHFKKINDTYGHAAGDLVLKTVAMTFSKMIRQSDDLARFGGEEFVILLPETSVEAATALAERLRKALNTQFVEYEGKVLSIHASFGISGVSEKKEVTLDKLYRSADRALYQSKSLGGNAISAVLPNQPV
ncbi:MAG: diguanylate cyclase [Chloroflexota bacterium]|nr:diguanylate cyclase [Chloroflexota bacterium]